MKKKLLFNLLSFSLIIVGCQLNEIDYAPSSSKKIQLSSEELLSLKYKSSPELNQTEILNLLNTFQNTELKNNNKDRASFQPISFQIKDKYYLYKNGVNTRSIENTEEQIPIYKVEIISETAKGLAIVSGDRRAPHILAYIDKIKEDQTSLSTSPNALLQWGEMYIRNEIIGFDAIKDSLYESAISKISKELDMESTSINYETIKDKIATDSPISRSTPVEEIPSNLKVKVAIFPMCPVAWGQWEPYNCMLPMGNCERFGPGWIEKTNYPTGYGPIAIAHLLACLETYMTFKIPLRWNYLTENKEIKAPDYFNAGDPLEKREMVGKLFKDIYIYTKSYTITNSNGIVTGSTCLISEMENYMAYYFNYNKKEPWINKSIKNSLKAAKPVFVYGKPDNKVTDGVTPFILDGIKECSGRIDNVPQDIDICYLHANFGFGNGYQDGYYLMDTKTSTITFETSIPLIFKDNAMTIITDIRNK